MVKGLIPKDNVSMKRPDPLRVKPAIGKRAKRKPLPPQHLSAALLLHLADQRTGRRRFVLGQHGAKKSEQKRLTEEHAQTVSGNTHESEHTIGFEPLNQTSGEKRGGSKRMRDLENQAPAYQEVKALHRQHIGTGTTNTADCSGMNSEQYRSAQRSLLEAGDVSSAVQLNQLGYAFDPNFAPTLQTTQGKAATDSYGQMVASMSGVTYAKYGNNVTVPVDAKQKAEMVLARYAAASGEFPSLSFENKVRGHFGVPAYNPDAMDTSD